MSEMISDKIDQALNMKISPQGSLKKVYLAARL